MADPSTCASWKRQPNPIIDSLNVYASNCRQIANGAWCFVYGGWRSLSSRGYDRLYLDWASSPSGPFFGSSPYGTPGDFIEINDPSMLATSDEVLTYATVVKETATVGQVWLERVAMISDHIGGKGPTPPVEISFETPFPSAARPSIVRAVNNTLLYFDSAHPSLGNMLGCYVCEPIDPSMIRFSTPQRIVWSTAGPVAPPPGGEAFDVDVCYSIDRFWMLYRLVAPVPDYWRICLAHSFDGYTWTNHGEVLAPIPGSSWEGYMVGNGGWVQDRFGMVLGFTYGGSSQRDLGGQKIGLVVAP